jgi:hypothetical protein
MALGFIAYDLIGVRLYLYIKTSRNPIQSQATVLLTPWHGYISFRHKAPFDKHSISSPRHRLDRPRCLEQLLNLLAILAVLDDGLEVRVAANVLLVDEDVWDGALARDLDERLLEVVTVALLVQFVRGILGAVAVEEALGVLAVVAVTLAKDDFEKGCISHPMYLRMVLGDVRMTEREYDVRWGVKDTCAHGMQRERGVRTDTIVVKQLLNLLVGGFAHGG